MVGLMGLDGGGGTRQSPWYRESTCACTLIPLVSRRWLQHDNVDSIRSISLETCLDRWWEQCHVSCWTLSSNCSIACQRLASILSAPCWADPGVPWLWLKWCRFWRRKFTSAMVSIFMLKCCYLENVGAHNCLTLKRTGLRLVWTLRIPA